jgi:hypothetical protein
MEIPVKISRHASRRMQLYKINKNDIIDLLRDKEQKYLKVKSKVLFSMLINTNIP